jgi:hypothetical protein
MNKEFIPYDQALALKELGFEEPCFGRYYYKESYPMLNPNSGETELVFEFGQYIKQTEITILAPLYQQAFRWFRKKYNLLGGVYSNASGWAWEIHDNVGGTHRFSSEYTGDCLESGMFTSFEKAELDCIKYLIEIVKEK